MSKGIYHWKLGDVALARICQKVYAKVQVVRDEKGLFFDWKVLGITADEDGSLQVTKELCYYTETLRKKHKQWLPYTCLHLAERSRPFYGVDKVSPPKPLRASNAAPKKRKFKEDHTLPLSVKPSNRTPDLNITYDKTHTPVKQGRYENAFNEFVRHGKEMLFDHFYVLLKNNFEENADVLDYLMNVDASTEDKFETVTKNIVTLKEVENYLHQCWRYNFVHKAEKDPDSSGNSSPVKAPITLHISWCLVCGLDTNKLRECINCPASYHLACRREWLVSIIHRKNPPQKAPKQVTLVEKILSSTRTICSVKKNNNKENLDLCPSCMWGPRVGYDDVVWHKLGSCAWWPARVLAPGAVPACLLARAHSARQWPLRYYVYFTNFCNGCTSAGYIHHYICTTSTSNAVSASTCTITSAKLSIPMLSKPEMRRRVHARLKEDFSKLYLRRVTKIYENII